jgi:phage shock protein A
MFGMSIGEVIAVASLIINLGIVATTATWGLAWAIGKIQISVADAIAEHRQHFAEKLDVVERRMGETVAAVRHKIHEVESTIHKTEIWNRDHFEIKGESERAMSRYERIVGDKFNDITRRLERMETKIDRVAVPHD